MKITINVPRSNYDIIIRENAISSLKEYIPCNAKTLLVMDQSLPDELVSQLNQIYKFDYTYKVAPGENSKSFTEYVRMQTFLLENSFDRTDMIIAFGGGVIGDLAGFVASTYLRGIRYINIPTTLLAQIDSSIGGKVAINHKEIKNVIGAFYHPYAVLIDTNYTKSLPVRQLNNGLIEALKAGLVGDEELFSLIEQSVLTNTILSNIDKIIIRSLRVKKVFIERDEKEKNLRKILNFGHTIGHALESQGHLNTILHGEAVGIGMLKMSIGKPYYERLKNLLIALNIDTAIQYDKDTLLSIIMRDKKISNNHLTEIFVDNIGEGRMKEIKVDLLLKYL